VILSKGPFGNKGEIIGADKKFMYLCALTAEID
jgi:hypothetical protein